MRDRGKGKRCESWHKVNSSLLSMSLAGVKKSEKKGEENKS